MRCHIALYNLQGSFIGVLEAPDFDPCSDDPAEAARDLPAETFANAYGGLVVPERRADDGSCGTFTMGPLTGVWEWLDFGDMPTGNWTQEQVHHVLGVSTEAFNQPSN